MAMQADVERYSLWTNSFKNREWKEVDLSNMLPYYAADDRWKRMQSGESEQYWYQRMEKSEITGQVLLAKPRMDWLWNKLPPQAKLGLFYMRKLLTELPGETRLNEQVREYLKRQDKHLPEEESDERRLIFISAFLSEKTRDEKLKMMGYLTDEEQKKLQSRMVQEHLAPQVLSAVSAWRQAGCQHLENMEIIEIAQQISLDIINKFINDSNIKGPTFTDDREQEPSYKFTIEVSEMLTFYDWWVFIRPEDADERVYSD